METDFSKMYPNVIISQQPDVCDIVVVDIDDASVVGVVSEKLDCVKVDENGLSDDVEPRYVVKYFDGNDIKKDIFPLGNISIMIRHDEPIKFKHFSLDEIIAGDPRYPNEKEIRKYMIGVLRDFYHEREIFDNTDVSTYYTFKGQIRRGQFEAFFRYAEKRGFDFRPDLERYKTSETILPITAKVSIPQTFSAVEMTFDLK